MSDNKAGSHVYKISEGLSTEPGGNCDNHNELSQSQMGPILPVYNISTAITMQPLPQNDNNIYESTSQSFNTINCISNHSMQISTLSVLHLLANVEQLQIQQIIDLSTLLGELTAGDQYRIKVPFGDTILLAVQLPFNEKRKVLGHHTRFTINLIAQSGENVFVIKKQSSMSNSLHKITVEDTSLIGTIEQNFTLLTPSFTVYDSSHRALCNIFGPNAFGCCTANETQFQITSIDDMHHLACLMHTYDNSLHDYTLLLSFPRETDVKLKILLLSASFLVDYLYFKHKRQTFRT